MKLPMVIVITGQYLSLIPRSWNAQLKITLK